MLARLVACAAFVILWPICASFAEGDSPSPLREIVVALGQHDATQRDDTAVEKQTRPPESAELVAPAASPLAASGPLTSEAARDAEPFGLGAEPVVTGEILAKWDGLEAQIKAESQVLVRCRNRGSWCPRAARRFLAIVNDGRARNGRARIGVINREINLSIVPTSDLAQWGVADRWSTPLETFATHRGDCEDYAIAKYVALRAAGIPERDIRLIVVRNNAVRQHHAVVGVRLDGDWLILDNRWLALVRDQEMGRATPLFELDENGVRRFVSPAPGVEVQLAGAGAS